MNDEIIVCKKCGKQLEEGKYCKICNAERKEGREKVLKNGVKIIGGLASLALIVITKGKFGDKEA